MFSIYVHIPFCLAKCWYCDFHSLPFEKNKIPENEYVRALCKEIDDLTKKYNLVGREVGSIYFGGGTPSLFKPSSIEVILAELDKHFSIDSDAEITLEANPGAINRLERLEQLERLKRLSIGVQSFNDEMLTKLGRIHSSKEAVDCFNSARGVGFKNVSIDLMWGLSGQSVEDLKKDLDKAISLQPEHISAYQLTVGKSASRQVGKSEMLPDEELSREMWILVHEKLVGAGYEHYEISNYSKKGFRCRHNENYWNYGEWLGVGSGAVSSLVARRSSLVRMTTSKDIDKYLRQEFEYETEEISNKNAMAEFCFLGLRQFDGIDLNQFEKRLGETFEGIYPGLIEKWTSDGYAKIGDKRLSLTVEGMLISDTLFKEFV